MLIKWLSLGQTIKEMHMLAKPTVFINGYQLPEAFDIEDLQYFLLE